MTETAIKEMRAQSLVELFLEDLKPSFFLRAEGNDAPFDFLIGFKDANGTVKNVAIQVKQTDKSSPARFSYLNKIYDKQRRDFFARSDMPVVLVVVNTKDNRLYYNFASEAREQQRARRANVAELNIPLKPIDNPDEFKQELLAA